MPTFASDIIDHGTRSKLVCKKRERGIPHTCQTSKAFGPAPLDPPHSPAADRVGSALPPHEESEKVAAARILASIAPEELIFD